MPFQTLETNKINKLLAKTDDKGKPLQIQFYLLPYFFITRNGVKEANILSMLNINGFVQPFAFTSNLNASNPDTDIVTSISDCLNTKTFDTFAKTSREQIEDNIYFAANVEQNSSGTRYIQGAIFIFLFIGSSPKSSVFYDIIDDFIENFKETIRTSSFSEDFSQNLIFLPIKRMYELCYTYVDEDATYSLNDEETGDEINLPVAEGIFLREGIINLYKEREDEVSLNISNRTTATFPFRASLYKHISGPFASQYLKLEAYKNKFADLSEMDESSSEED